MESFLLMILRFNIPLFNGYFAKIELKVGPGAYTKDKMIVQKST